MRQYLKIYQKSIKPPYSQKDLLPIILTAFFLLMIPVGFIFLSQKNILKSGAQTTSAVEFESGVVSGNVTQGTDPAASNGQYVQLGSVGGSTTFQPSAPYYATFFYIWSRNPNTDSGWAYWEGAGNAPPNSWFSHYIPDPNPAAFDPANELYSANNYTIWKWQASKMAEAKQEVAIASWWGPDSTREDGAFNNIINSFMGRSDNPYPNLRWSMYYEDEGFSDPSVTTIANDLTYIQNRYTNSPYFFKINGKPVIFVYGNASDTPGTMLTRWNQANSQVGNAFYLVLKLYSGYTTATPQPDSWHEYAPANRGNVFAPYIAYASPGFWLDDGSAVRLPRDLAAFQSATTAMVNANVTWKLTQTWNEWGEGTAVEPGQQSIKNGTTETIDPSGAPFGNQYIDILNGSLPALEQGVGSN